MQVDSPSLGHPAGQPIKTTPWPSVEHTVCAAIDLQVRWSALIDWCPDLCKSKPGPEEQSGPPLSPGDRLHPGLNCIIW